MPSKSHLKDKVKDTKALFAEVVDDYIVLHDAWLTSKDDNVVLSDVATAIGAELDDTRDKLQGAQLRTAAWIESFDALLEENHSLEAQLNAEHECTQNLIECWSADIEGRAKLESSVVSALNLMNVLSEENAFGLALVDPSFGVFNELRELVEPATYTASEIDIAEAPFISYSDYLKLFPVQPDGCEPCGEIGTVGGFEDVRALSDLSASAGAPEDAAAEEDDIAAFIEALGALEPVITGWVAQLFGLPPVESEPDPWSTVYQGITNVVPTVLDNIFPDPYSWQVDVAGQCTPGDECW